MLSFFPRGVLDEILTLIESISEGFPSYSFITLDDFDQDGGCYESGDDSGGKGA